MRRAPGVHAIDPPPPSATPGSVVASVAPKPAIASDGDEGPDDDGEEGEAGARSADAGDGGAEMAEEEGEAEGGEAEEGGEGGGGEAEGDGTLTASPGGTSARARMTAVASASARHDAASTTRSPVASPRRVRRVTVHVSRRATTASASRGIAEAGAFRTAAERTLSPEGQPGGASHDSRRSSAAPARVATRPVATRTRLASRLRTAHATIKVCAGNTTQ